MNERERDEELIAEQVKQLLLGGGTNNNNNKNNGDDDFESESESESAEEEATISMRDYVEGLDISTGLSSSASSVLEASKELAILIQFAYNAFDKQLQRKILEDVECAASALSESSSCWGAEALDTMKRLQAALERHKKLMPKKLLVRILALVKRGILTLQRKARRGSPDQIPFLPEHLWHKIFTYLSPKSLALCSCANKWMNAIIANGDEFWMEACLRLYPRMSIIQKEDRFNWKQEYLHQRLHHPSVFHKDWGPRRACRKCAFVRWTYHRESSHKDDSACHSSMHNLPVTAEKCVMIFLQNISERKHHHQQGQAYFHWWLTQEAPLLGDTFHPLSIVDA